MVVGNALDKKSSNIYRKDIAFLGQEMQESRKVFADWEARGNHLPKSLTRFVGFAWKIPLSVRDSEDLRTSCIQLFKIKFFYVFWTPHIIALEISNKKIQVKEIKLWFFFGIWGKITRSKKLLTSPILTKNS